MAQRRPTTAERRAREATGPLGREAAGEYPTRAIGAREVG
ncbi:hypothetical protein PLANPX_5827 [Lacipirellula parvula]|uniref:Uncharacterized protein n=1 Tax=Lacipirellula parvula TaxID=2650471 RepID=A0A5K7XIH3_9BACT|nr:hypothetical protein PLANPX_5827 [Lacipirellula parvula]